MQLEQKELSSQWTKYHPCLRKYFYNDLPAPETKEDAIVKMQCHQHAANDIQLQLDICETEIKMELAQEVDYNHDKLDRLHEQKIRLINAKRFNDSASHAYWFYLQ